MESYLSFFELFFASMIWGFGFVATLWLLPHLSPDAIMVWRFLIAFVFGVSVYGIRALIRPRPSRKVYWRDEWRSSILSGVLLGGCVFLQAWGLETTSATNSGFITCLYVVIIPVFSYFFLRQGLQKIHIAAVIIALVGMSFMMNIAHLELKVGDLLTLGSAIVASAQIMYLDRVAKSSKDAFLFNTFQCFWAGLIFLPGLLRGSAKISLWNMTPLGWFALASLSLGSTSISFYLQLRAQKKISPSVASLFYLLEAPFASLFAFLLIGENIRSSQVWGGLLIMTSCGLAVWAQRRGRTVSA